MSRQDLINHIEAELETETDWTREEQPEPVICEYCGKTIAEVGEKPSLQTDYVIHRVPSQDRSEMQNAFYCSVSCLDDHMDELFAPLE